MAAENSTKTPDAAGSTATGEKTRPRKNRSRTKKLTFSLLVLVAVFGLLELSLWLCGV